MDRVGRLDVLSQDKVTFSPLRNVLPFRANRCNSRLRAGYRFPADRWLLLVALIGAVVAVGAARLGIGFNFSQSAPRGIYQIVGQAPTRGALIAACLPTAVADFGRARGYLGAGDCPGGTQPVLKTVGAVAGDRIELAPDGVAVNGIHVLARAIETRDSAARALPHVAFGSYRVAADEVWLLGLHGRSWDSRYFGPIPLEAVLGVARPVLAIE